VSKQKIIKIGNSLGITLPSRFIQNLSLKSGDRVELSQNSDNSLILNFPDNSQLSLLNFKAQETTKVI
jgi:antitoxin component of MazEF toxin-antitoxin module